MRSPVLPTLLAAALAACGSSGKPEGQVIARVNGTDITRPELNGALPRGNAATGSDKQTSAIRNGALDQLVLQELVAQEARRQGIDKSQAYLIAARRADNEILSTLLSQRILRDLHAAPPTSVADFIRANPTRFERRELLRVDQLRFPAGAVSEAQLRGALSLEAVATILARQQVRAVRGQALIDTATMEPAALSQLLALPAGQPFVVTENGATLVSVITGHQAAPLTGQAANQAAATILSQNAGRDALLKQLQALRKSAKIEYQAGFAAPATLPGLPTSDQPARTAGTAGR